MVMNFKRFCLVFLAFFALIVFNSAMAYDFRTGGVYYKIIGTSPNKVAVTNSGTSGGYTGAVVIPDSVSNNGTTYRVTEIADSAFLECRNLTSISLPSTLTKIGVRSFKFCSRLSEVVVPEGVTTIDQYAFDGSNFTKVTLPASLSFISVRAFDRCYYIDTVKYNGSMAQWCGLDFPVQTSNPLYYASNFIVNNQLVTNLVLPTNIDTVKPFTFIGASCIAKLTIPNTVTYIGDYAFANCEGLDSLHLPNSVVGIGGSAFENCKRLVWIKLSDSLDAIGIRAFSECAKLTSVTVPNSVSSIGYNAFYRVANVVYNGNATGSPWGALMVNAFYQDSLFYSDSTMTVLMASHKLITNAVLPNTVTTISNNAFTNDSSLTTITLPNSLTTIGNGAFWSCASLKTLTIPNSVKRINSQAFYHCPLEKVYFNADSCKLASRAFDYIDTLEFGDSVRVIMDSSFIETTFYYVIISKSVKKIGRDALKGSGHYTKTDYTGTMTQWCDIDFANVYANPMAITHTQGFRINGHLLRNIVIPDSVTVIKPYVFCGNDYIDTLIMANSVREVGDSAFWRCNSIKSITFSDSLERIGDGVFEDLFNLEDLALPTTLKYIGKTAFKGCGITTLTIPDSVAIVNDSAFKDCLAVTSLYIPNSVLYIGKGAFSGCFKLENVVFDDSVRAKIDENAFSGCSNLTSIDVPATVDTIENNAFLLIANVNYLGQATGTPWGALCVNCYLQDSLYYLDSTKIELRSSHRFINSAPIPNTVTIIGDNAFRVRDRLRSVDIPTNLTALGSGAFSITPITSMVLPNTLRTMGDSVFMSCRKLRHVILPDSLNSIGASTFYSCDSLDSVTIPASLQYIERDAFYYCSALTSINLPDNLINIGNYAFGNCSGLSTVVIPDKTETVGDYAFSYCSRLEKAVIGKSVINMGSGSFFNCHNLDTIVFKSFVPPNSDYNIFNRTDTVYLVVPCSPQAIQNYRTRLRISLYMRNRKYDVLGSDTVFTTITVASNDNTMGAAQVTTPHSCPDYEATISATANAGYHFVQWSDGNTDNPRTLTVTADTVLVAEFQSGEGINETANDGIAVGALAGRIVIQGVADEKVFVTDVLGRVIYNATVNERAEIAVKNQGIYFVKIGIRPAQKVVVAR